MSTLSGSQWLALKAFSVPLLLLVLSSATKSSQTTNDDFGSCAALSGASGARSEKLELLRFPDLAYLMTESEAGRNPPTVTGNSSRIVSPSGSFAFFGRN